MAKIFPSRLPSYILLDPMRRSEVTIYNLLRDFGDSWTILYSARWTGKSSESRPNPDGEADFIVMHPRHGILVLEAKGGQMAFNGHFWTQNGRELDKSPFDQAKYNKYAIQKEINRVLRRDQNAFINEVFDGVIFPACVTPRAGLPQEAPHEAIIDEAHLPSLEQRIIEVMKYRQGPYFERTQLDRYINIVLEAFARPVEFENPLCTKIADEERQIASLTEGQFKAVVRMRDFPRCSICGGAGTGKTLLAIKIGGSL
jgi:Nuclease-related domain